MTKPPKGMCAHCRRMVEHNEKAAYKATGYLLERAQGGANMLHHPTRADGWITHARFAGDCFDQWYAAKDKQGEQMEMA